MYISRSLDLARELTRRSVLLLGPRRTGKSALIRNELRPDRVYNLLHSDTFARLATRPSLLREEMRPRDRLVVVDEIQRLPGLFDEIHDLIETTRTRFLLTGSSARRLRRGHVNLMAGRARTKHLHPFVFRELEPSAFDLDRALTFGLLPPIHLSDSPWDDLGDYVGQYLQEEIRAEAAVRKLEAFSRFLVTAALCNATEINFEGVARDAQVPARTVREYFQVMVDTLIARLVEPFELRHATRKAGSRARLYFFDIGVANRLLGRKTLAASTPEYGAAFETYIAHELHAWRDYTGRDEPIRYFRTQDGLEVDFLVGDHTAIELKSTTLANEKHAKPLVQLHALHKTRRRLLVTRDPTRRKLGPIEIWPWRQFLVALWDGAIA